MALKEKKRQIEGCRVVAFMLQKGGSGKTSTTINIGSALNDRGKRVLVVDADPQCNTTSMFMDDTTGEATMYDLLTGNASIEDVIHHGIEDMEGIDYLPCDKALKIPETEDEARMLFDKIKYPFLKDALSKVRDAYDYILIDTSPYTGFFFISALVAADGVVIPLIAEKFSFDGLADMVGTCQDMVAKGYNKDLKIYGLLINQYRKDQSGHRNTYNVLMSGVIRYPAFKTPIRFSKMISAAQDDRASIFGKRYRASIAARDYLAVSKELEGMIVKAEGRDF